MKKLLKREKKLRQQLVANEKSHFILKSITKNFNFFILIRWNAFLKLKELAKTYSKTSTVDRCLFTLNKKRFNRLTGFSRHVFLKTLRSGSLNGFRKSSW